MIKLDLQGRLSAQLAQLGYQFPKDILLELPKHDSHGDYATNCAFMLTKVLKRSPQSIALEICEKLESQELSEAIRFEPLNGFINLTLSDTLLWNQFSALFSKKPSFSVSKTPILLEYVSANPTGPLHIGHGRWAVLGSVLNALLNYTDHVVSSEFYINDAGNQVRLFYDSVNALKEGRSIPDEGYHGHYVQELAQLDEDPLQENLKTQRASLKRIGVQFDNWFSEKLLHDDDEVAQAIQDLTIKGYTFEEEGALWFKSTEFGDTKDRVLIKKDGQYTYFAVDIAYHRNKLKREYGRLINIWGADHHGYVPRVKAAIKALTTPDNEVLNVMIGQMVNLLRDGEPVKMSKRTGELISLDEVVDEIGVDATRYFLIQKSPDSHIDFDLDVAKKKNNENPVYYIQYAHARICRILEKAGDFSSETLSVNKFRLTERRLIFHCLQCYDTIRESAQLLMPHKLTQYAWELARLFHHFYEDCPILKASDTEKKKRLIMVSQTRECLRLCLGILGISAPTKM